MSKLADNLYRMLSRLRIHSKDHKIKAKDTDYFHSNRIISRSRSGIAPKEEEIRIVLRSFEKLFDIQPGDVPSVFSLSTQRVLSRALRFLFAPDSPLPFADDFSIEKLYRRVEHLKGVHSGAVTRLLDSNESLELRVRWLAWALDSESKQIIKCLDSASFLKLFSAVSAMPEHPYSRHETIVFWQSNRTISSSVVRLLLRSRVRLVISKEHARTADKLSNFVVAENSAVVERATGDGRTRLLCIPSSAALCQGLLRGRSNSAWYRVREPSGFVRLDSRMSRTDVERSWLLGRIAVVYADGTGSNLAISSLAYTNLRTVDCLQNRRVNMQKENLERRYKMSQERGTEVMIEGDDALLDRQSEASSLIVVDLQDGPPRSKDELKKELKEEEVSSARELLVKFPTKITGQWVDVNGETREASISVVDEETFTPNGITLGDEELFNTYITLRTYENVGRYCEGKARSHLTDDEVERLKATAEILEKSLEGDE